MSETRVLYESVGPKESGTWMHVRPVVTVEIADDDADIAVLDIELTRAVPASVHAELASRLACGWVLHRVNAGNIVLLRPKCTSLDTRPEAVATRAFFGVEGPVAESLRELQEQKAAAQASEAREPSYTVGPKPAVDYEERAVCEDRDYSLGFRDGFEQKMNAAMVEGFALDRYVQGVYVLRRAKKVGP